MAIDDEVSPQYREQMRRISKAIDFTFNGDSGSKKVGFCLMVFNFGDGGRTNYMSNASRPEIVNLLKEMIERFEAQAKGSS